ncbi:MAG: VanZ family protein [Myxococcales bacterium]|nr:VanZ family protein [Myxococcales bacterium]
MLGALRHWWPPIAYMVLIWIGSSLSNPVSVESLPFRDKGVHALEYAILAVLLARALAGGPARRSPLKCALLALVLAVGWGYLDELHQAFVPSRDASLLDVLADALGASLGSTAFWIHALWRSRAR